jgi:hypothetical protein
MVGFHAMYSQVEEVQAVLLVNWLMRNMFARYMLLGVSCPQYLV